MVVCYKGVVLVKLIILQNILGLSHTHFLYPKVIRLLIGYAK